MAEFRSLLTFLPPTSPYPSNSSQAGPGSGDFCAVVLLDPTGRITAANGSAGALLPSASLVGEHFASLFAFEVVSTDPEFLEAQWEVILGSASERPTLLSLRSDSADTPREVRVRIEKATGSSTGYIATLQTPLAAPPTASVAGTDATAAGLKLLTENASAGYFDLNLKTCLVVLSPAWKKMLGYAAPELPDTIKTWEQLIHPDDSGAAPNRVGKKIPAGTRPVNVEFRMKHRRGHWVWIQCIGVQQVGAPGVVDRVVGLHLDISERKDLEDSLVANDSRLQELSGPGPLAAFELDFLTSSFWFSPAWEKLLGYDEGELPLKLDSFGAALPPEEASAGVAEWLLKFAPGQHKWIEPVKLCAKDGKPISVLIGAHRSVSRKRELQRVVGFACPLPGGTSADAGGPADLLRQAAFAALAEGVIIADARGQIVFANPVAARLARIDAAAACGQPVGDVFRLVNRQSGRPGDDPVEAALSADNPLPLCSTDALASPVAVAPPTPIVWTARVALGPDGKAQGVVIVFRNPEEMTLTWDEVVKANRLETLGLLAGGIAHDFNNLLTTILGAVSLGKDSRDYNALEDAEKACLNAKGLTKQLLAVARGGVGTQVVCTPKEILQDAIKIAAAGSTAAIECDVPEGTENVLVDRAQILQVFQNLIVNALQAMPPEPHRPQLQIRAGNVALTENQVPGLAASDYVEFEVRDNGCGIKDEHKEKIFDPFFTTKKHGTGLGLATVLSLVRKHGGQIGLVTKVADDTQVGDGTQVGVGTAFTVYLPKAEKPVEIQARRAASLRFGTGRVLFMDDDPKISALTGTMLESLNYKYDLAANGDEAIALYKRYLNIGRPYDAVLMDLTVIGGMGGEECFKVLKELDPDVRAIACTGYDNDDMNRKLMDLGFSYYLTKPYRVPELGKSLKAVLG